MNKKDKNTIKINGTTYTVDNKTMKLMPVRQ